MEHIEQHIIDISIKGGKIIVPACSTVKQHGATEHRREIEHQREEDGWRNERNGDLEESRQAICAVHESGFIYIIGDTLHRAHHDQDARTDRP